jgi:hypothetical protein
VKFSIFGTEVIFNEWFSMLGHSATSWLNSCSKRWPWLQVAGQSQSEEEGETLNYVNLQIFEKPNFLLEDEARKSTLSFHQPRSVYITWTLNLLTFSRPFLEFGFYVRDTSRGLIHGLIRLQLRRVESLRNWQYSQLLRKFPAFHLAKPWAT